MKKLLAPILFLALTGLVAAQDFGMSLNLGPSMNYIHGSLVDSVSTSVLSLAEGAGIPRPGMGFRAKVGNELWFLPALAVGWDIGGASWAAGLSSPPSEDPWLSGSWLLESWGLGLGANIRTRMRLAELQPFLAGGIRLWYLPFTPLEKIIVNGVTSTLSNPAQRSWAMLSAHADIGLDIPLSGKADASQLFLRFLLSGDFGLTPLNATGSFSGDAYPLSLGIDAGLYYRFKPKSKSQRESL